jgi:5-methylcytosine-specific restriction endonuclease McrA
MPVRPPTFRPRGSRSPREYDIDRGSSAERGYDSRWRKAAKSYLRQNPLCAYCALDGLVAAASLVDHLYPHRRFDGVFWRTEWWVSACTACHSGAKQQVERRGKVALDDLAMRLGRPVLA